MYEELSYVLHIRFRINKKQCKQIVCVCMHYFYLELEQLGHLGI